MLTFDEVSHTYWEDAQQIPGVSSIIQGVFLNAEKSYYAPGAAERGKAIHKATEQIDRDPRAVDAYRFTDHWGYLEAWEAFKLSYRFEAIDIEKMAGGLVHGYAGTMDRICRLTNNGTTQEYILDIKSGKPDVWHGIQLAAYRMLEPGDGGRGRVAVYIAKDGSYKPVFHDDHKSDEADWKAALRIVAWRKKVGKWQK